MRTPLKTLTSPTFSIPVGLHVDNLDAQHGPIQHKVACLIKDDICQPNAIHLLQLSLHSHPPPKLHVRQLLPHLLQLCEHLTHKAGVKNIWISHTGENPGSLMC